VRPPRLGGNRSVGLFASRSPFRPNPLGLSAVRMVEVDEASCEVVVSGADLMDQTPIYDIKPYVAYSDAKEGARSGFVDENPWEGMEVSFPEELREELVAVTGEGDAPEIVAELLSQDPRPRYQDDPERIYGMAFGASDVRFKVSGGTATVTEIKRHSNENI